MLLFTKKGYLSLPNRWLCILADDMHLKASISKQDSTVMKEWRLFSGAFQNAKIARSKCKYHTKKEHLAKLQNE